MRNTQEKTAVISRVRGSRRLPRKMSELIRGMSDQDVYALWKRLRDMEARQRDWDEFLNPTGDPE